MFECYNEFISKYLCLFFWITSSLKEKKEECIMSKWSIFFSSFFRWNRYCWALSWGVNHCMYSEKSRYSCQTIRNEQRLRRCRRDKLLSQRLKLSKDENNRFKKMLMVLFLLLLKHKIFNRKFWKCAEYSQHWPI